MYVYNVCNVCNVCNLCNLCMYIWYGILCHVISCNVTYCNVMECHVCMYCKVVYVRMYACMHVFTILWYPHIRCSNLHWINARCSRIRRMCRRRNLARRKSRERCEETWVTDGVKMQLAGTHGGFVSKNGVILAGRNRVIFGIIWWLYVLSCRIQAWFYGDFTINLGDFSGKLGAMYLHPYHQVKWEINHQWLGCPLWPLGYKFDGIFSGSLLRYVPRLRLRCAQSERHASIGGWMTIFREGYCRNNQTIRQNRI